MTSKPEHTWTRTCAFKHTVFTNNGHLNVSQEKLQASWVEVL